ncbi:hypothetical protein [Acinetobacter sp. YH12069]|uniref:hypothetical protein n=1 Tax=Acinetobacter sp. YH12069 TaxID=2601065 RepID=UPI0015D34E6F|nr:hypothetical protein [Acinetobacter sp. YH12069]
MSTDYILDAFVKRHLNPDEFNKKAVVEETAAMFSVLVDVYVTKTANETFYNLPYKDISVLVFNDQLSEIKSNTFNGFTTTIIEEIKNTFGLYDLSTKQDHVIACYEKFALHIELALIQKQFMLDSAKEANRVADIAQKQAEFARKQAKKAKDMSSGMVTNFVTILGIFASIIFTLFGGVNLIGSTVKLLEVNSRWPYLTFIIALLMICLLTLLNMMVKWINSMSNLQNSLENNGKLNNVNVSNYKWYNPIFWDFYTKSVSCFFIILLISLVGMYKVNKENLFSMTTETTTTKPLGVEESSNKAVTKPKPGNENKEITVVEKFTLSNHLNEKGSDKE